MKKTLLLADDSPTIQKVINLTFADEGIDVIAVGDGNAAIQRLREITPDLVMADVHMPGLNGYQICERIRQSAELSKVPVILLVGSFEPFDEEEAKRVGADDFLMKPFQSIRQLVGRVAALLDSAREESPAANTGVAEEAHAMHISDTPSITPEDIFRTPWVEPEAESGAAETGGFSEFSDTDPDMLPAAQPAAKTFEEADDLSDFDTEFERKFPDAAALSSESSFGHLITAAPENPAPEISETPEIAATAELAATAEAVERVEAAETVEAVERVEEPGISETFETPAAPQPAEMSPEPVSFESPAEAEPASIPERLFEEEHKEAFSETAETTEAAETEDASILNLGEMYSAVDGTNTADAVEHDFLLEIEPDTGIEEQSAEMVFDTAGALPVEIPEEPEAEKAEVTETETAAEAPQYNFREADVFDDDSTIEESFHGFPVVEHVSAPSVPETTERVSDAGPEQAAQAEAAQDQAEGFSAAPQPLPESPPASPEVPAVPPQQISPDAIEAIAQRVLDKLTAKLVRDMAPEMRDLIMSEISGEKKPDE